VNINEGLFPTARKGLLDKNGNKSGKVLPIELQVAASSCLGAGTRSERKEKIHVTGTQYQYRIHECPEKSGQHPGTTGYNF
jgi:hypothetical protein